MNRRDMLKAGVAAGALGLAPRLASAQVTFAPVPKGWRSYVLTTRVEPMDGATRAWIPLPTFAAADWQRPGNVSWTGNAKVAERVRDPQYGAEMLRVEWAADQQSPVIEVTAQVQTQDRSVVPGQGSAPPLSDAERKLNLAATELLPTDGLVKETAEDIVKGKKDDVAKARALYEWVVDNTFRNPKTLGCGVGDISRDAQDRQPQRQVRRPQRALCRPGALGRPAGARRLRHPGRAARSSASRRWARARRTSPRRSTAAPRSGCRAAAGRRSIRPTCARSCSRSRRPTSPMTDPKVVAARKALFGAWEGNWVAFNDAHDVKLPGTKSRPSAFLMYPQAENKSGFLDSLDPDNFKYTHHGA